ncbi:hypothetical protein ONZ45_g3310 [Pleurotus djamor]|nr:hypothetical protein ONZ45_g3310 [Pleurotus djamor]
MVGWKIGARVSMERKEEKRPDVHRALICLPDSHPCTLPCHAPSACPETEPCDALITVTCPCGRIKQAVHCGRSVDSTNQPRHNTPKCNNDCAIAKRNARLADALGINPHAKAATATYSDELVSFARSDPKFLALVEKAFSDFVNGEKRTQVLPHMPMERRKFVHDLATVYRLDTQMVDQEPHRSVQLLRRLDTRLPTPTLSSHMASLRLTHSPYGSSGKLADVNLRSSSPSWRTVTTAPSSAAIPTTGHKPVASAPPRAWGAAPPRANASTTPTPTVVTTTSNLIPAASASTPRGASPLTLPHSAHQSRSATPALSTQPNTIATGDAAAEPGTPVPDDWEDDADV